MFGTDPEERVAHLVDPDGVETLDVLGPTIELLTPLDESDDAPCVMRGTIPPGVIVPLHSHPDPETFFAISGEMEGLSYTADRSEWVRIAPGEVFHVPGWARHAWRNPMQTPAVMLLVSTSRIGRFFEEVGTPVRSGSQPSGPPPQERLRHFMEAAERYGHWLASPEENARIGLPLDQMGFGAKALD